MDTFHWDKNFETGLEDVDKQHHQLVDLINRFGEVLNFESEATYAEINTVFNELIDYTKYHFEEEESLMRQVRLDTRFIDLQIQLHTEFVQEALKMHEGVTPQNLGPAKPMLTYLVHWLAFHILGVDQSMSRQISAVQTGQKPEYAYLDEAKITEGVTEPLLSALDSLFQKVFDQNHELIELNRSLELKVAERTRALSDSNDLLEEIALTDVLTGLPNRRHALARLSKEWNESTQKMTPLSCMMIDADGFKQINDNHGHDAGDEVLRQLSRQLRYAVRTDDIVCRLGGDEFLVICPNTNQQGVMQIAEQMRKAIEELRIPAGNGRWPGSVSVGVASRMPNMHVYDDLIKAADEGVYLAKRNGRNRVACSEQLLY